MSPGKMRANEASIDSQLVGRLIAAQFPRWTGLAIRPVPSAGTDNALFRLGLDMAVRLPRLPGGTESVTIADVPSIEIARTGLLPWK